jgi:hypothetical protein
METPSVCTPFHLHPGEGQQIDERRSGGRQLDDFTEPVKRDFHEFNRGGRSGRGVDKGSSFGKSWTRRFKPFLRRRTLKLIR